MKKSLLITIAALTCACMTGCKPKLLFKDYIDEEIDIYRETDVVDKTITLRYYKNYDDVPYVKFSSYMKEFYSANLSLIKDGSKYRYETRDNQFLEFDANEDAITFSDFTEFGDYFTNESSYENLFIRLVDTEYTERKPRTLSLKKYNIDIKEANNEAYVPVSLLSKLIGGIGCLDVAYNGKALYVIDMAETLTPYERTVDYYGSTYNKKLNNLFERRGKKTAEYCYNELCFVFDNLRGETKQLIFGDDNLQTLGLDGLLSKYYPELKEYLLSTDKIKFYAGIFALFAGLFDGGHTGILSGFLDLYFAVIAHSNKSWFYELMEKYENGYKDKDKIYDACAQSRYEVFEQPGFNYYLRDRSAAVAYIGFNSFDVDYRGWKRYYTTSIGDSPVETDTFAFVLSKLKQAKEDNVKTIIFDLTTNDGGDTNALNGLIALLNHGKSTFKTYNCVNDYFVSEKYEIDANLDGVFDEKDTELVDSFDFNVGILTSGYSFSCANLFPSMCKDLGYKIIGQQSGGGSCAISIESTVEGIAYARSSHLCFYNDAGQNVDTGVPVDYEIEIKDRGDNLPGDALDFYNFDLMSSIFQ